MEAMLAGLRAMASNLIPLITGALTVFVGLGIIGSAVMTLVRAGDPRANQGQGSPWVKVFVKLLIGALLLQFGTTMQDMSQMLFGSQIQDYRGVLAYANVPSGAGPWKNILEVCLLWVVMLGWVAAFRGFLQWNAAASGSGGSGGSSGDGFWKGFWHIVGGAVAINMTGAMRAFLGG